MSEKCKPSVGYSSLYLFRFFFHMNFETEITAIVKGIMFVFGL